MDIQQTHAGGVIKVNPAPGNWGALPTDLLQDQALSLDSRAVAAWLATRPSNWQISIFHLLKTLGLGKEKWLRIARELENGGYLLRSKAPCGPGGRWVWQIEFCAIPFSKNGKTNPNESKAAAKKGGANNGYEIDENGIHYLRGNLKDNGALAKINAYPSHLIKSATKAARELDPENRAFPSAVLKQLLRQTNKTEPSGWSRGAYTNINHLNDGGEDEIIDI